MLKVVNITVPQYFSDKWAHLPIININYLVKYKAVLRCYQNSYIVPSCTLGRGYVLVYSPPRPCDHLTIGVLMGRGGEAGEGEHCTLYSPLPGWPHGGLVNGDWYQLVSPPCRPHLDAGHHDMTMGGPGPGCPHLVQLVCNIGAAIKGDTIHCDQS